MTDEELIARLRDLGIRSASIAADRLEALAAPVADVAGLVALLEEARADLAAYVDADYPETHRARYPDVDRRYKRDMELCWRIDDALAAMEGK